MKWIVLFFATMLIAAPVKGAEVDSSGLIFNDTIVNNYRITFYQAQWDTLLRYNKEHDEVYMPARFTWFSPEGDSIILDSVGVRYKGNSSYVFSDASPKKPFKIAFDQYRKNQRFFTHATLNFSNSVQDPTCMREKMAYDVLRFYVPVPRAAFATLTIADSLTKALYTQVEQVDKRFVECHFGNSAYNLYKAADQGATLEYRGATQSLYSTEYELKTNEKANDWAGLLNLIELLTNTTDDRFVSTVGTYLDLDNVIRYLAFTMVNACFDSYVGSGRNYYLYDTRKVGAFKLIPWDLDQSFGMYPYSWNNVAAVDAFAPSNVEQRPLMKRVLANDSLRRVYAGYMQSMVNGPHCSDSIKAMAYRFKAVIDSSVQADTEKFFNYEQFSAGIDTELVLQEGITRKVLPGLVSLTRRRNAFLEQQIEHALPITFRPAKNTPASGASLQCDYHAATGQLMLRYRIPEKVSSITVKVYSVNGSVLFSKITTLNGLRESTLQMDMQILPAGYYTVRAECGVATLSEGVVVLK